MLCAWVAVALSWIAVGDDLAVRQDYEARRRTAPAAAEAQVELALWCEAKGLEAERHGHLARALLASPDHGLARALMGHVRDAEGRWRPADDLSADPEQVARRGEYERRRAAMDDQADAHWDLAIWCEQNGLPGEARAHLWRVVHLDRSRDAAWKRLGYRQEKGQWMPAVDVAATRAERQERERAHASWIKTLTKLREQLGDHRKRDAAEAELAAVVDPRAAGAVWAVFVDARRPDHRRAAQLLGQIDSVPAARSLALIAVFSGDAHARQVAGETLRGRNPREFVDLFIRLVREPIEYMVQPVGGPGSPGRLVIREKDVDRVRVFAPPPLPTFHVLPTDIVGIDGNGLPVVDRILGYNQSYMGASTIEMAEAIQASSTMNPRAAAMLGGLDPKLRSAALQVIPAFSPPSTFTNRRESYHNVAQLDVLNEIRAHVPIGQMRADAFRVADTAQRQLELEVSALDAFNVAVAAVNGRVLPLLTTITNQDLGANPVEWSRWWTDQLGMAMAFRSQPERSTIVEQVPIEAGITPPSLVSRAVGQLITYSHSCFAAGTPVHTSTGLKPIENVETGDLVLSHDGETGALAYQPVLAVAHNPPDETFRIDLGDDAPILATGIHRFWKVGSGWVMARELKAGDRVRVLGGAVTVRSVESDRVQPVFNLTVADAHSFLVGKAGALAHDNSLAATVDHPFDALVASDTLTDAVHEQP